MVLGASLLLALAACGPRQSPIPSPRHDLGWRLRELEHAFGARADPARRAGALPAIEEAVRCFFRQDLECAARSLDRARAALLGAELAWPEALAVAVEPRLLDLEHDSLRITLCARYGELAGRALGLRLRLQDGAPALAESEVVLDASGSATWTLPPGLAPEGDHAARIELLERGSVLHVREIAFSLVRERDARLAALERSSAALPAGAPRLEAATLPFLATLLGSLARGSTEETDYPAARLLGEAEAVLAAAERGERGYGPGRPGEFWLALPAPAPEGGGAIERGPTPARVLVPAGLGASAPLVVALHGFGGSENLFFDGYGDGEIARQCAARRWLLVAPRITLASMTPAEIVEALAQFLPVDRERVFLVGHSMGAALALQAALEDPRRYRGLAALGGGFAPSSARDLAALPVLAAAGERDFGRPGVESLQRALVAAGSEVAELRILPACEHLTIVQEILPDVLRFFDALATAPGR